MRGQLFTQTDKTGAYKVSTSGFWNKIIRFDPLNIDECEGQTRVFWIFEIYGVVTSGPIQLPPNAGDRPMPSLIKTIPGYPAHHWAYIIYTKLYHILYGIQTNGRKIYTEPYHILHITPQHHWSETTRAGNLPSGQTKETALGLQNSSHKYTTSSRRSAPTVGNVWGKISKLNYFSNIIATTCGW